MFPQITITGQPRERGRQYGQAAAPQIIHSIASYARLFAYECGRDWEEMQACALDYLPILERYTPDLLDEIHGIAEGSGRKLGEILALNARTELLGGCWSDTTHSGYTDASARNQRGRVPMHGECTTVAALPGASAGGKALLAQTWDWYGDQRAACVVLRVEAPGMPTILTVTEAGILAKIGLNSAGVGVCLNILHSDADGQVPGMPVHVLLRRALQTSSAAEAIAVANEARAGASSCVTVVDANGGGASMEVTPGGIGIMSPDEGLIVHTNHCITERGRSDQCVLDPLMAAGSAARFGRAGELLGQARGHVNADTLMGILRDHTNAPRCICRHPNADIAPLEQAESVMATIMDLTAGVLYVAPGIPCQVPFTPIAV